MKIILDVIENTGITATAGIGTNLYLCKVAMDILAKHIPADENGVRIAELDEMTYRQTMWSHQPLTDFWRVGRGYAKKLEAHGMFTMGDVARMSVCNEDLLYQLFGKNAELLIDHSWGWEPCTIADVKAYKPENKSIVSGQVLQCPYESEKAKLVLREMADQLALNLLEKRCVTDQLVLTVGYSHPVEFVEADGITFEVPAPTQSFALSTMARSASTAMAAGCQRALTARPICPGPAPPPASSSQRRWSSMSGRWTSGCWCGGSI